MGEMKHTPGPWQLGGGNVDWSVEPDDANVGCWTSQPIGPMGRIDPVCIVVQRDDEGYRSGDDELDANARLIAAAPDLCAVAQAVVDADQSDLGVIDLLLELKRIARTARAALSKASPSEGGEA